MRGEVCKSVQQCVDRFVTQKMAIPDNWCSVPDVAGGIKRLYPSLFPDEAVENDERH